MTLAHLLTAGAICRPFLTGLKLVEASANGEWPRLNELGPNVPKKLRKVIETATSYDPEQRPATIEDFKRELDNATPAVSFVVNDGCLESGGGEWAIKVIERKGKHDVEVRYNRRRKSEMGCVQQSKARADRAVAKLVTNLGYGPR